MGIERLLFHVANALRYPVLVLALLALAAVLVETGALGLELTRRRRRSLERVERMTAAARAALAQSDSVRAIAAVRSIAATEQMAEVLTSIVLQHGQPYADERVAKRLADFEYTHIRRLERTRILVRFGPALGLMGTLIPLSPALSGLAKGNVAQLTDNLQVAFSVTVAGLLVGAVAFAISLVRDRLYGQEFSDVEYVAASLAPEEQAPARPAAPSPGPPPPDPPSANGLDPIRTTP